MCQIITAPSLEKPKFYSVFLAGGITDCKDWQQEVITELKFENISVFNPRQKNFCINNEYESLKQIVWEFERLEQMDIFSMYFCNSNSVQPICLYELGRNVLRIQNRFPNDWENRIIVSIESGYKRIKDVLIQMSLCAPKIIIDDNVTPEKHARYIKSKLYEIYK